MTASDLSTNAQGTSDNMLSGILVYVSVHTVP